MQGKITNINPGGLIKNPAFSQAVITEGNGKTIYIGGQNAVEASGNIVGKGNTGLQAEQVMRNIQIALVACDAAFSDLIKLNIYIVQGHSANEAFVATQPFMKQCANPPAISVVYVAGLVNPEFLVEIEAIAFKPAE